jgi:hypothetical protein
MIPLARNPDALIVHPHCQRTGGGTLRKALATVLGQERVYSRLFLAKWKRWHKLTDADLSGYLAYTDLSNYREIGLARTCLPIALLRHPLYRAVSLYDFVARTRGHVYNHLATHSSLEDFYRIASRENPRYFRNVQTSRICGRANADLALLYIRTRYLAVGFTSNLGELVRDLSGIFNWPQIEVRSKSSEESRYDSRITPRLREMVLKQNEEDLLLFEAMAKGLSASPLNRPFVHTLQRRTKRVANVALHLAFKLPRYIRNQLAET